MALVVVLLLVGSSAAGAASSPTVSVDRWIRSVCRETADWMGAREGVRQRVAAIAAELTAGELPGRTAAEQLAATYARASKETQQTIDAVRGAGTPKVPGGKALSTAYQDRLAEYQDAYDDARESIAGTPTKDTTALATTTNEVAATLASDLGVVGGDPLEELRIHPELADGIAGSCGDVDTHLGATVDPAGCRAALATAREYTELNGKLLTAAEGSPEETALGDQLYALVTRWRSEIGGCNTSAVLGPCRTPLESAQAVVQAAADYDATPEGSPEEQAATDAWFEADSDLASQLPKCTA